MVRTVATAVRASGGKSAKAARTSTVSTNNSQGGSSSDRHVIGGNPVHPRETPSWQKPITNFFIKQEANKDKIDNLEGNVREIEEAVGEGSSKMLDELPSDEMKVDERQNEEKEDRSKEICQTEDVIEKETIEEETVPLKKQNFEFYKNLEEIEKYSA